MHGQQNVKKSSELLQRAWFHKCYPFPKIYFHVPLACGWELFCVWVTLSNLGQRFGFILFEWRAAILL